MTINSTDIRIRPFVASDIVIVLGKDKVLYAEECGYPPDAFSKYVSNALDEFLNRNGGMLLGRRVDQGIRQLDTFCRMMRNSRCGLGALRSSRWVIRHAFSVFCSLNSRSDGVAPNGS